MAQLLKLATQVCIPGIQLKSQLDDVCAPVILALGRQNQDWILGAQ